MRATLPVVDTSDMPIEQLSQRELRNHSGRVLRAVKEGQSFVLTNSGEPVGRIVPINTPTPSLPITRAARRSGGWSTLGITRQHTNRPLVDILDDLRGDRV